MVVVQCIAWDIYITNYASVVFTFFAQNGFYNVLNYFCPHILKICLYFAKKGTVQLRTSSANDYFFKKIIQLYLTFFCVLQISHVPVFSRAFIYSPNGNFLFDCIHSVSNFTNQILSITDITFQNNKIVHINIIRKHFGRQMLS